MEPQIIAIEKLKPHEQVTEGRVSITIRYLKQTGELWFPILVEKEEYIILDGHHRVEAFKRMGLTRILAFLVDYDSPEIKVGQRRKGIPVSKDIVRKAAKAGKVFPHKTTRHVYPHKNKHFDVPLEEFK